MPTNPPVDDSMLKWIIGGLILGAKSAIIWVNAKVNRLDDRHTKELAGKVSIEQFEEYKQANQRDHATTHHRITEARDENRKDFQRIFDRLDRKADKADH